MIKVGDFVTRKKYNNDILFKVTKIDKNKVILYGVDVRLCADSNIDDLILSSIRKEEETYERIEIDKKKEDEYFYIPGLVLHIDSDKDYLEKSKKYYKTNNVNYIGYIYEEREFETNIEKLIRKHTPDIVVITGHDAYYKDNKYKNSKYFIQTVKEIRKKFGNDIVIISGACQSDYYNLIKSGSTYASSPSHINIHALDPAIIATYISLSSKNKIIDIKNIINKTKYGKDGIGGIESKGKMKIGFPRLMKE